MELIFFLLPLVFLSVHSRRLELTPSDVLVYRGQAVIIFHKVVLGDRTLLAIEIFTFLLLLHREGYILDELTWRGEIALLLVIVSRPIRINYFKLSLINKVRTCQRFLLACLHFAFLSLKSVNNTCIEVGDTLRLLALISPLHAGA